MYCSDGHRAEARRRRLAAAGTPAGADQPIAHARRLLRDAMARLDQAAAVEDARDGARWAQMQADATAQVLEAQQMAAEAARRSESVWTQLDAERAVWETQRRVLVDERERASAALHEMTGVLEGTRAELEHALVRHHSDVEELTHRLQVQAATHAAAVSEMGTLRRSLSDTSAALERAERRAEHAEAAARSSDEARRKLEVHAARADEQAKHEAAHVRQLESDLKQAKKDLVAERRQRGTMVATLRRELASAPVAVRQATGKSRTTA